MKTKFFLKVLKKLILINVFIFSFLTIKAQMECRSILGGHLTPFHKKVPLLWAVEGTMAPGLMTDFKQKPLPIGTGMILAALDFTMLKKHNFYIEGGTKRWMNSTLSQPIEDKNRKVGMRQAFYNFNGENTKLKIGLHETKLGDLFIIDERVMGASLEQNIKNVTINASAGSVLKNFARMGQFCANRHIYNIIGKNYTENIGEKMGETNYAGINMTWKPKSNSDAEVDEFSEFGSSESKKNSFTVNNISFIFYDEFGKIITNNKLYSGSIVDLGLPYNFGIQTGAVYQNMENNNTVVYILKLKKSLDFRKYGITQINATYFGKQNIDDNALFTPLFSNLFIGEIMRMDAPDFPIWQTKINHNFNSKINFHIGLNAVGQVTGNKTSEIDFELGAKFFSHLKVTTIFSRVTSQALPNDMYMGRVELRLAF